MSKRFAGKVVKITEAASGVGTATGIGAYGNAPDLDVGVWQPGVWGEPIIVIDGGVTAVTGQPSSSSLIGGE